MDTGLECLYAAAHAGNIDSLRELLLEDKLILERAVSTTVPRDNPLHIAAIHGYAGFAKEIVQRNLNLAREVNSQGLTPLHLAAVHGHIQVAEELIQVDGDLCHLRHNKDGYLPVHIAVIKRRHVITTLLIEKWGDSQIERTHRSETLLHLGVKANCLETVQHLTSLGVTQLLLNTKDENGNTCLHLAFAGRQQKVIEHLLNQADIDVNQVNSAGFTPLDVLLVTNHEMGDLYIGELLRAAGGKTTKELQAYELADPTNSTTDNPRTSQPSIFSTPRNQVTRSTTNLTKVNEKMDKIENLIVVATLVATVTFAAALNPPGGFIQIPYSDDDRTNSTWIQNWKADAPSVYPAGSPVYLWKLKSFYMFDTLALLLSISVILLCLCGIVRSKSLRKFMALVLWLSITFMVLAFFSALAVLFNFEKNNNGFQWFYMMAHFWVSFVLITSFWLFVRALSFALHNIGADWQPSWMKKYSAKVYKIIKWFDSKIASVCIFIISCLVGIGIGMGVDKGLSVLL